MIVRTKEDLKQVLDFIAVNDFVAVDTETEGLNTRKHRVIGIGVSNNTIGFYLPILIYNKETETLERGYPEHISELLHALKRKKLLFFNLSFDGRMIQNNFGVDLITPTYCDVLLLKHTCNEDFPLDLKGIAASVFGADVKKEKEEMLASIRANGGTATEYYKADLETMAKYCVQDCVLTFRLFEHYSKQLKADGLEDFYYKDEVLPLYKEVTIPMEANGVRLDVPKIEQSLAQITQDLQQIEANILTAIEPLLGTVFTPWFLNKDYEYKATGRIGKLMKKEGLTLIEAQQRACNEDHEGKSPFNLLSKHHLKKLFFDTLGEKALSYTDPSKTFPNGQPQVDEEFLESMASKYPWCAELVVYNKLTKLKGTYMERLLEEQEDGRFYPAFQQHRTVSGRYSGDMQQLPRPLESGDERVMRYTNLIREFVIADEGSQLMSADYEQLEPSVFSHTSGDPALHNIFNSGLDFYSEVAIRTEGFGPNGKGLKEIERIAKKEFKQGLSSDKVKENYLGKVAKAARQKAKAYSLGIAYGMTGYKLQFEIGVPQETAEGLVQDYLNAFPRLAQWMQDSRFQVATTGQIKTEMGRIRRMPQAKRLHQTYGDWLENSLELWKRFNKNPVAYAKAKADRKTYVNCMNNAINFQVQGLAASIVNRASIQIARELYARGLKSKLALQVHDEIVLNVPNEEKEIVGALVQDIMQNIVKLAVPLRTVPQFGTNYRQCK